MPKLSEPEILAKMPMAKGWERHGDMLIRSWQFPSFRRALEFVNQVAALAEKSDHHPDIILSYRKVRLELSTHSEGGLTERDFALAGEVNAVPTDR
jgi:4a-hydroxytetrahydrobiopterin dehydratase